MITAEYVGKGAVVIDVGINVDNTENYAVMWIQTVFLRLASVATPVPGGVGSVTTSVLAKHLLQAAKENR